MRSNRLTLILLAGILLAVHGLRAGDFYVGASVWGTLWRIGLVDKLKANADKQTAIASAMLPVLYSHVASGFGVYSWAGASSSKLPVGAGTLSWIESPWAVSYAFSSGRTAFSTNRVYLIYETMKPNFGGGMYGNMGIAPLKIVVQRNDHDISVARNVVGGVSLFGGLKRQAYGYDGSPGIGLGQLQWNPYGVANSATGFSRQAVSAIVNSDGAAFGIGYTRAFTGTQSVSFQLGLIYMQSRLELTSVNTLPIVGSCSPASCLGQEIYIHREKHRLVMPGFTARMSYDHRVTESAILRVAVQYQMTVVQSDRQALSGAVVDINPSANGTTIGILPMNYQQFANLLVPRHLQGAKDTFSGIALSILYKL